MLKSWKNQLSVAEARRAHSAEWDAAWKGCCYATFFHSREWAELFERYLVGSLRADARLIRFSDGQRAVLPVTARRVLAGRVPFGYISAPAGTYGGWISADPLSERHAELLTRELIVRAVPLTWRINPIDPHGRAALDAVRPHGPWPLQVETSWTDDHTHMLRLDTDIATLHRRWRKGHRSAANKAHRDGLAFQVAEGIDDWRAYYALYQDALVRWGDDASSRYDWSLFAALGRTPSDHVRLWLAKHDGEVIAGALCLYGPKHVAYWHGASSTGHQMLRPVHGLLYEAIAHAIQAGHEWFDFNPSGGHEGVESFKRGFAAEEMRTPVIRTDQLWRRMALACYRRVVRPLRSHQRRTRPLSGRSLD